MSTDSKAGTAFNKSTRQPSTHISTKEERDALIAARPKPKLEKHLTPGGITETSVRQKLNLQNEARIERIENRLKTAQSNMRFAHKKAQVRGKAKTDFDQSR